MVTARSNYQWVRERHRVAQVIRFRGGACCVLVDEHNLAADALHDKRIARGGADEPAADDADFHGHLSNLDMQINSLDAIRTNHVENPLNRELFDVVTRSPAVDVDVLGVR